VEDSVPIMKTMTRILTRLGCSVTCASNGEAGLEQLTQTTSSGSTTASALTTIPADKWNPNRFDVVFCDFLMPIMNGIDMMSRYQKWKISSGVSSDADSAMYRSPLVVGVSATAVTKEQNEAFDSGMHMFIPKPVEAEQLKTLVNAIHSILKGPKDGALVPSSPTAAMTASGYTWSSGSIQHLRNLLNELSAKLGVNRTTRSCVDE
jgi:CheY-like chemotaxis protein